MVDNGESSDSGVFLGSGEHGCSVGSKEDGSLVGNGDLRGGLAIVHGSFVDSGNHRFSGGLAIVLVGAGSFRLDVIAAAGSMEGVTRNQALQGSEHAVDVALRDATDSGP